MCKEFFVKILPQLILFLITTLSTYFSFGLGGIGSHIGGSIPISNSSSLTFFFFLSEIRHKKMYSTYYTFIFRCIVCECIQEMFLVLALRSQSNWRWAIIFQSRDCLELIRSTSDSSCLSLHSKRDIAKIVQFYLYWQGHRFSYNTIHTNVYIKVTAVFQVFIISKDVM